VETDAAGWRLSGPRRESAERGVTASSWVDASRGQSGGGGVVSGGVGASSTHIMSQSCMDSPARKF
jgi:hypothetical protein